MSRKCYHGYKSRHPDYEWYVWCPGGSRLWNTWYFIANRLPVPDKMKGTYYRSYK